MRGLVSGSAECLAPDHWRGWDIICSVWRENKESVLAGGRGRLWMDRVEERGWLRPHAGELRHVGVPHHPQPGDGPDPAPQGACQDRRRRTALRARRDRPFWRALTELRRGRRALAAHSGP